MGYIGINSMFDVIRTVSKKLVLNEKVVDYLYRRINARKPYQLSSQRYVIIDNKNHKYIELAKDKIKELLKNEHNMFVCNIVEYTGYLQHNDETYEDDYYNGQSVLKYSLENFLYEDESDMYEKPYFATHIEEFDFEDIVEEENRKLIRVDYH